MTANVAHHKERRCVSETERERERMEGDTCERGQCECVHTPAKLLNSRKSARVQNLKEPRDSVSLVSLLSSLSGKVVINYLIKVQALSQLRLNLCQLLSDADKGRDLEPALTGSACVDSF